MQSLKIMIKAVSVLLRGVGQVVFQNNPISGLVILTGLFFASLAAGTAALVGVIVSTLTAVLLKVDKDLIGAGLLGFNGVLVGIAISLYSSHNVTLGDLPVWKIWSLVVMGSAFSTVVMMALSRFLSPWNMPALTMPFVLCAWIFVGSVEHTVKLETPGALESYAYQLFQPEIGHRIEEYRQYTLETWYMGIGKGFSEIFLQDSAIAGYLILLGILINSRISAIMGLLAALLSITAAMLFGVTEESIRLGLHSYNPILTALAVVLFVRFTISSGFYALFGVVVTVWVSLAVGLALYHLEFPVYTFPFVIVTWALLLGAMSVGRLRYILPAEALTPEANLARFAAQEIEGAPEKRRDSPHQLDPEKPMEDQRE
ncbi:Urea transporter [Nitrosococcus oceani ATCC 19707]|uniref:Urea transporter n=3 Tax=Nitrosococcus oceani TaxID=1229 RepID=Q3J766_NITOC|nr:Urea transporter [Nitrosococcus oceani ATCC 19707]EDZ65398.1 urea transporter [Nitrosococcus oceani AFC27]KFI18217.1 urea transporter [Nitrosococcus oceani C-27]KFI21534.1 urea transporter [Nitrosococcus oceani]